MKILPRVCFAVLLITMAFPAFALSPKEQEAAGAILFRDKGCAYCHGKSTEGTHKGPSLVDVRKRLKPEQIANQIKEGGQKMPPSKNHSQTTKSPIWLPGSARNIALSRPRILFCPVINPAQ